MAGRHSWNKLETAMSPQRRQRIESRAREEIEAMLLSEIRRMVGMTQTQVAEKLGVTQVSVSQIERQDDIQLSTLQRLVEALGGELEVLVKLPTGRIAIRQFDHAA